MSTALGRIVGKPSVNALRKRFSGRVIDHPVKTRATSAVGILFPGSDMQGVEHRPVRALDPMELKRTDPLRLLIQAYCFCACRRIRERIGQELADNLRQLRRGYWQPNRNIIETDCDATVLSVQLAPEARVVGATSRGLVLLRLAPSVHFRSVSGST
jgi:hypothetical protein